jgi:hypothetical protein
MGRIIGEQIAKISTRSVGAKFPGVASQASKGKAREEAASMVMIAGFVIVLIGFGIFFLFLRRRT